MHLCTRITHQGGNGGNGNSLGTRGDARQAQTRRNFTIMGNAAARQMRVFRAQPNRVAIGRGVLHRAIEHRRVDNRSVGLKETNAACLGQLNHLGKLFPFEAGGERTQRINTRLI